MKKFYEAFRWKIGGPYVRVLIDVAAIVEVEDYGLIDRGPDGDIFCTRIVYVTSKKEEAKSVLAVGTYQTVRDGIEALTKPEPIEVKVVGPVGTYDADAAPF